jgi:hypothetical protein
MDTSEIKVIFVINTIYLSYRRIRRCFLDTKRHFLSVIVFFILKIIKRNNLFFGDYRSTKFVLG